MEYDKDNIFEQLVREYNEGVTGLQIAESISSRLAQDVLACGVNEDFMIWASYHARR